MPRMDARRSLLPSLCALGAGVAWVIWVVLNARTRGGLDAGAPAVGERLARAGALLMVAWNVLLLPAAVDLGLRFESAAPDRARLVTVVGVAGLLFWAYGGATHGISTVLEVTYISLSAAWWIGLGLLMRREWPVFGMFTLVLGAFAAWDALLTALEPVPFTLYLTASPKLPLSIVWDFWLAWVLLGARVRAPSPLVADAA